jgi:hypothetical protein
MIRDTASFRHCSASGAAVPLPHPYTCTKSALEKREKGDWRPTEMLHNNFKPVVIVPQ